MNSKQKESIRELTFDKEKGFMVTSIVNDEHSDNEMPQDPRDVDDEESDNDENDLDKKEKQKKIFNREIDNLLNEITLQIRMTKSKKKPKFIKGETYSNSNKTENKTAVAQAQKDIAKKIFRMITEGAQTPPQNFKYFDFYIIVPLFISLGMIDH